MRTIEASVRLALYLTVLSLLWLPDFALAQTRRLPS